MTGFLVLEIGDNFGDSTLLMKEGTDHLQIIGLVGPGKLDIGVTALKCANETSIRISQRGFGKDIQRRAVLGDQVSNRHTVDCDTRLNLLDAGMSFHSPLLVGLPLWGREVRRGLLDHQDPVGPSLRSIASSAHR